jgi:glycosyltransferase involved in cell wall biosynthesis
MNPVLTFIVVCKGRLEHLKASLPKLIQQPKSETIVVDSSCPDGAADWVEKNYPTAKIVKLDDDNEFNRSKSRNAGLNLATTKWICFIDAEIIIKNDFTDEVLQLLHDGNYYTFSYMGEASGTCIATLYDLISVGGYDEAFVGWGGEDSDLFARLRLHGINHIKIPIELIESTIKHSDDIRNRFHHEKDIFVTHAIAELYAEAKFTTMIATQELNISIRERKRLFKLASDFITSHIRSGTVSGSFNFRIPLQNAVPFLTLKVEKEITIKVNLKMLTYHLSATPAPLADCREDPAGRGDDATETDVRPRWTMPKRNT